MKKLSCRAAKSSPTSDSKASLSRLEDCLLSESTSSGWNLSKTTLRKLIITGFVYVNGKRVNTPNQALKGGETIDVYFDPKVTPATTTGDSYLPLRILYEDEAIICFDKPADLPTQPTVDGKRPNLYHLAQKQLEAAANGKAVYLGMHHRLDRDTSGVLLFTREPAQNAFIAKQFAEHLCSKLYVTVVHGHLPREKGRLESFLGSLGKVGPKKMQKFGTLRSGGKKAITDFVVLASNKKYSLVEVSITTGRTHQIRVHLSEMGHPVVGDTLYGSPESAYREFGRHLLHAHALTIEHPVSHNLVRIESPVPNLFRQLVQK